MDVGRAVAGRIHALCTSRGWSWQDLARRAGVAEDKLRSPAALTLAELAMVADALEVGTGHLVPEDHPLEGEWDATAWEILSATAGGFRAKVCVLGKLAEFKLYESIVSWQGLDPRMAEVVWNDSDTEPDFKITWAGTPITVECKNVRRDVHKSSRLRVELQKTRNSKDGSNTRSYPRSKFDVLAACLFNQTRTWRFVYCATRHLAGRASSADLLAITMRSCCQLSCPGPRS